MSTAISFMVVSSAVVLHDVLTCNFTCLREITFFLIGSRFCRTLTQSNRPLIFQMRQQNSTNRKDGDPIDRSPARDAHARKSALPM